METRFHTQEVVENPNPHQNRKDNPPQELRCGRAHVGNIGDQGHHQGYPRPAGHGGEGALDPQRKLKQAWKESLKTRQCRGALSLTHPEPSTRNVVET